MHEERLDPKDSAVSRQRLKTVELVVERTAWTPAAPPYTAETFVPVKIEAFDMPMRAQVKAAGGRWDPEKRLWFVKFGRIAGTKLESYIQVDKT